MMEPLNMIDNKAARSYRKVTVRPMPESAMIKYNVEMEKINWGKLFATHSTHEKAVILQSEHVKVVEKCFPEKVIRLSSDDCPWWTEQLQKLHRLKQRVYRKQRKSLKWKTLEKKFQAMKTKAKKSFYLRMVNDMIEKDQNQWYLQLKRLTNKGKTKDLVVDEISHLSDKEQADTIADHIESVSQEYDHLLTNNIKIPSFPKSSTPHITVEVVTEHLQMIKTKKSTAPGDVPAKLIKAVADHIAAPLADVINSGIRLGQWPDIYKMETITPAPKCYPPKELDNLRPKSNLFNYCKIGEKINGQITVEDMVEKMDPCQFGNLRNTSIQHYLISLIHRLMSSLDRNAKGDIFADCVTLFDYKQAFFLDGVTNLE